MAAQRTRRTRTRHRTGLACLAVGVVLAVLAGACSSDDSADSAQETSDGVVAADLADGAEGAGDAEFGLGDDAPAEATTGGGQDSLPPVETSTTAVTGERIIKEGTVTLEVDPGQFDAAFSQVISRAQTLGGHVAGSSSATDPDGLVAGQVTIRVPVRSFEDLLTAVAQAGQVVDREVTSQDVSEEFTDLESRRRNLQAQERFYLGLLEEAQSITDAIAVQQQLEGIQSQIEQITGRLNLLEDRTSFSTLTVRIREQGADGPRSEEDRASLSTYVDTARDTLIGTLGALLVVATFSLPFLVLGLLGWLVYAGIRRRRRERAAAAPVPAGPTVGPAAATSPEPAAPRPDPVPEEPRP